MGFPPSLGSCVTCFIFVLLLPPSCTTTHRTRLTRLADYLLSTNQVIFFLPPSHPLTKISRENSLKILSSLRVGALFYEFGRSKFSLYWIKTPTRFKQWPCSVASVEEQEVCNLFDKLSRRLPTCKILSVYKSSQRWTDFQGMLALFIALTLVQHMLLVNIFSLFQISWQTKLPKRSTS